MTFSLVGIGATDVSGRLLSAGPPADRVRASLLSILSSNVLFSIATVNPDGTAHINTAYFSYSDALELYFLSHPASSHCRNLARNPSIAATVFSSTQQWTDPGQGVQLFGTCAATEAGAAEQAERVYRTRFPGYERWKASLRSGDPGREYRLYRFDAASVSILDERNLGDALFVRASVQRR
jgi:uncharacterized protein YhbP (UPF0306 family)